MATRGIATSRIMCCVERGIEMSDLQWPEEGAAAIYRQWKFLADSDGMEYADNWLSMRYDAALARLFSGD